MGVTERDGVLWSRLRMFLNNGPEMLDAIGPLLQLGVRSAQPVVGDQRHIFFVEQLKQERQSLGRPALGKLQFSLTQHDDRIAGPCDLDGGLKIKGRQFPFFMLSVQRGTLQPRVQRFRVSGDGGMGLSQQFLEPIVS